MNDKSTSSHLNQFNEIMTASFTGNEIQEAAHLGYEISGYINKEKITLIDLAGIVINTLQTAMALREIKQEVQKKESKKKKAPKKPSKK